MKCSGFNKEMFERINWVAHGFYLNCTGETKNRKT